MDLIIQLIFRIFQAIFEKDKKQRQQKQSRSKEVKVKKKPAAKGKGLVSYSFEQWLKDNFAQEPLSITDQALSVQDELVLSKESKVQSNQEVKQKVDDFNQTLKAHREAYDRQSEVTRALKSKQLRPDPHRRKAQKSEKKLAGISLKNMILSQVLLGPCRARQNMGISNR